MPLGERSHEVAPKDKVDFFQTIFWQIKGKLEKRESLARRGCIKSFDLKKQSEKSPRTAHPSPQFAICLLKSVSVML